VSRLSKTAVFLLLLVFSGLIVWVFLLPTGLTDELSQKLSISDDDREAQLVAEGEGAKLEFTLTNQHPSLTLLFNDGVKLGEYQRLFPELFDEVNQVKIFFSAEPQDVNRVGTDAEGRRLEYLGYSQRQEGDKLIVELYYDPHNARLVGKHDLKKVAISLEIRLYEAFYRTIDLNNDAYLGRSFEYVSERSRSHYKKAKNNFEYLLALNKQPLFVLTTVQ
jgi:hypothetical protein